MTTDEFDPTRADRPAGSGTAWGACELYARLNGGSEPISTLEAQSALPSFGYTDLNTLRTVTTAITEFAQEHESVAGHASADTACELPIYAEVDELFQLIQTTDRETITAQVTGPYAPLFRPLTAIASTRTLRIQSNGRV